MREIAWDEMNAVAGGSNNGGSTGRGRRGGTTPAELNNQARQQTGGGNYTDHTPFHGHGGSMQPCLLKDVAPQGPAPQKH